MDDGNKKFTVFFITSLICYSIASITITCVNFAQINSDSYNFDDIAENWQTGAITQVAVASSCPSGYEVAFNYTWPGTSAGCYCGNVNYALRSYYDITCTVCYGSCSWNETLAGCSDIDSFSPVGMSAWGQVNNNNVSLCVKRSQETWLQVAQQSGPNCTSDNSTLKQCGSSPDNIFCTSEPECPINNVQIVNLTLPYQAAQLANCTPLNNCTVLSQTGSSAKVFYYQRGDTYDALPTAQMRLNEYSMCLDMSEDDITPGRDDFKLLNDPGSNCYTEGADMWNWTDSMTEAQLFSLNGLTNTINYLERFGYYSDGEDGSDYTYSVFSRSYIPWNIACRSSMVPLVDNTSTVHKLRDLQLALMIVTILSGIVLGLVIPVILRLAMKGEASADMKRNVKCMNHLVKIPSLALQITVLVISNNTKGFFENIITQDCSTQPVLQTLTNIAHDLENNYTCNAINIAFQCVIIVIGCFYFHRRRSYTDSSYYQPQQQAFNDNKSSLGVDVPPQYPQYQEFNNNDDVAPQSTQYTNNQFGNGQFTQNEYSNNEYNGYYAPPNQGFAENNDDFPPNRNNGNNF